MNDKKCDMGKVENKTQTNKNSTSLMFDNSKMVFSREMFNVSATELPADT